MELVVNPAAGGGRAATLLGAMTTELARVGFSVNVHRTSGRASLVDLTRKLVRAGAGLVGVMGGDGTFHDAIGSLLDGDTMLDASRTVFAALPAGTGGDLAARTLEMPSTPEAVSRWLARATPMPFDVGSLEYVTSEGARARTLFVNIASCGMSGRVDELVAKGPRWITGKSAYFVASARALVGWKHKHVRVTVDGAVMYEGAMLTTAVANGRAFGGGMCVAPEADAGDGLLDVVVLGDFSLVGLAQMSRAIYDGSHTRLDNVHVARGRSVTIEPLDTTDAVLLDVDGETPGRVPGTFSVLSGAIRLLRVPRH
jgi:diacylglycerol kinase family enzyme